MECRSKDELLLMSEQRITFLNVNEKIKLLKNLDSFNALAFMSLEDMISFCGRRLSRVKWDGKENLRSAEKELALLKAKRIGYLLYTDAEYPALLKETVDAPFMLFYRGDPSCLRGRTVSVVGTRRITPEGKRVAVEFARNAVLDGCTVVSGLAYGVDAASHTGAVDVWYNLRDGKARFGAVGSGTSCGTELLDVSLLGRTAAVLPCGCDAVTPVSHGRLAGRIIESGGCIISEYAPGTEAANWRFVHRNRIIAALSPAVVVIQAPAGSGALITAQFALEYNRDVLFHRAAFGQEAFTVRKFSDSELKLRFDRGQVSKSKIENTPEHYLEAGAPVIENYADYLRCLREVPGIRSIKTEQLELFQV